MDCGAALNQRRPGPADDRRGEVLHVVGGTVVGDGRPRGRRSVTIDGGRIVATRPIADSDAVVDATGLFVVPGFIDLQVNGGVGVDLTATPERWIEVAEALPRHGVTAWCPTIVTAPRATRSRLATIDLGHDPRERWATPLGWHLEGPMLAPNRLGVHRPEFRLDPVACRDESCWRNDDVALVTLAPELAGAGATIERLVNRGVVVSMGHSDATEAQAMRAIDVGVTALTHAFNACRPIHQRETGLLGVGLTHAALTVGLIADGVHLSDRILAMAWRSCGPERTWLVSDASAAAPRAQPDEHAALAGSQVFIDHCVRHLATVTGATLEEVVATVTSTPAGLLGLRDRGRLTAGMVGDVVLLDDELTVVATIVRGRIVHGRAPALRV